MLEPSTSPTVSRVSDWLIHWRWPLLVISVILTAAGYWPSQQLEFDTSIVNLFAPDDPVLTEYVKSTQLFGGDEVVVVSYTDPELLTPAGLQRVHDFADRFRQIGRDDVQSVLSLADGPWPKAPLDPAPLYKQVERRKLTPEELKKTLLDSPLFRDLLIGDDGQTTALTLSLRPKRSDAARKAAIIAIQNIAEDNEPFETVVAGGPMLTHQAAVYVDDDSRTLGTVSTIVLCIVIWILFRRIRWVILPLAVVHTTLIWTRGLLWLTAARLSMVSTTLTALVTVVGVASMIQVTARYAEERKRAERRDALHRTLATAGPAVFWASLTTAAGFGSLIVTSIVPVRDFAIMLAIASLLVFFAAAVLAPAVVLAGRRPSDPAAAPGEELLDRILSATMAWSLKRPWQVAITAAVLLVLMVFGIFHIHTETDFTRNFRESSDLVKAYHFIEKRLGGIGVIQFEFGAPDGMTPEFLDTLRKMETEFRKNESLTSVLGIADVLDFVEVDKSSLIRQVLGNPGTLTAQLAVLKQQQPKVMSAFWNAEQKQMRIMLRAREESTSKEKDALIAWLSKTGHGFLDRPNAKADIRVTGVFVLLNHLVSGLVADQLKAFLLATVSVFLIMWIAFRSFSLAVVGLVPKIGPILMVLGAMGWLGMPFDMGTPMIASVSIGISVGFSIHYLYRFRHERMAGIPFDHALEMTHSSVGGAMVLSNLALVIGFGVLTLSNFIPTVHFSILADVALIGGLAGNLLVLPPLLLLTERMSRRAA